jgi:hypothetical protein
MLACNSISEFLPHYNMHAGTRCVTFDDLGGGTSGQLLPHAYQGVMWGGDYGWGYVTGSTYKDPSTCGSFSSGIKALSAQSSSGPNVAFNRLGQPVNISFPSGGAIRGLVRFKVVAAWDDNLELKLTAVKSGTILGSIQVPLSMSVAMTVELADYALFQDVTDILFSSIVSWQNRVCLCCIDCGWCNGEHFVVDDMQFKVSEAEVPGASSEAAVLSIASTIETIDSDAQQFDDALGPITPGR